MTVNSDSFIPGNLDGHGDTAPGRKAPEEMSMDEKLTEILITMREVQTAMAMFQSSPMSKMLGGAVFGGKK